MDTILVHVPAHTGVEGEKLMEMRHLFGQGVAFPVRLQSARTVAFSNGPENIRESIQLILLTERGERLMLPEFGAGLKRFLFQPDTVATWRLIEEEISQALGRWEPRIKLEDVQVEADAQDRSAAIATIRYSLISNQSHEEMQMRIQLSQ